MKSAMGWQLFGNTSLLFSVSTKPNIPEYLFTGECCQHCFSLSRECVSSVFHGFRRF